MSRRRELWRRPEATRGYAHVAGIFNSSPICQHPQCCHRQQQPMPRDPCGVSPSSLLPLPPNTLKRPKAQLYPEAKSIPTHSRFIRRSVGHHDPRLGLVFVPYYDHCSTTPFARGSESCPRSNICIPRPRYEGPRLQASSSVGTEHDVDLLSDRGAIPHSISAPTVSDSSDRGHTSPTPSYLAGRLRTATPAAHCRGHSPGLLAGRMCQAMGIAQLR